MADTRKTSIGFTRAIALSLRVLFAPDTMAELERTDELARNALPPAEKPRKAVLVRRAFGASFALVCFSIATGYGGGLLLSGLGAESTRVVRRCLQLLGAGLLLWGTLFVRGWEIQTIGGVTLTERVNQWIYRALYCAGTSILSLSIFWGSEG